MAWSVPLRALSNRLRRRVAQWLLFRIVFGERSADGGKTWIATHALTAWRVDAR